jgi:hypothetical protein
VSSGGGARRARTRRLTVAGHRVRIVGDESTRPFRGFFSGDELPGHHEEDEQAPPARAGSVVEPPAGMVAIEVDGKRFEAHREPGGWFHLHSLPFQRFDTVEQAAREIVRLIDLGVLRGRP